MSAAVPLVPAEPPPSATTVLTREPVRIVWVVYGFVQAVVTVLLATEVIDQRVAAIVTGVALAAYVAVSELFVRASVVALQPLEELAAAQATIAAEQATGITQKKGKGKGQG